MKNQNDLLPLQVITDNNGERWAFDDEAIFYLETQEGAPFWHLYQYHDLDNPTAERCAELLRIELSDAGATAGNNSQYNKIYCC